MPQNLHGIFIVAIQTSIWEANTSKNISNWHMDKISSVGVETTALFYQALLLKLFGPV